MYECSADVAELADALASGASGGNPVEVRILSSASIAKNRYDAGLLLEQPSDGCNIWHCQDLLWDATP